MTPRTDALRIKDHGRELYCFFDEKTGERVFYYRASPNEQWTFWFSLDDKEWADVVLFFDDVEGRYAS